MYAIQNILREDTKNDYTWQTKISATLYWNPPTTNKQFLLQIPLTKNKATDHETTLKAAIKTG